jgi:hypothetical protein
MASRNVTLCGEKKWKIGKVVPAHDMKTYTGRGGITPLIFNLGARKRLAVNITPWPLHPQQRIPVIIE